VAAINTTLTPELILKLTVPPFEYNLRVSPRARHVRLRVNPYAGLEVTIPKRFPKHQIQNILLQNESWISKQLIKHNHSLQTIAPPDSVALCCMEQDFSIVYQRSTKTRLMENDSSLLIVQDSPAQAIKLLRQWIRQKAQHILIPQLNGIADEFGFSFTKTIIRSQKSRWGSCSSSGTISLNDQLLFMPAQTVRYLMIHELCHTRFMNHSRHFWQLVEDCCPNHIEHEKILDRGRETVPVWFLKSLYQ
jgi:predicted metal-dependent hydrolase